MTAMVWVAVLLLGCPKLTGGPFDELAFPAVLLCLAAGIFTVGLSAADRTYPGAVLYVIAMTLYLYFIPELSENLNVVTPAGLPWEWTVTALYAVLIPGAWFLAPFALWLFDSGVPEQQE